MGEVETGRTLAQIREEQAALRAEARRLSAVEAQRKTLLPQLEKRGVKLEGERLLVNARLAEVVEAIKDIEDGQLTDFRLRAPRKKKAADR